MKRIGKFDYYYAPHVERLKELYPYLEAPNQFRALSSRIYLSLALRKTLFGAI